MLDHISLGVRNLAAARRFYDAAFKALGYKCLYESDGAVGYGSNAAQFWLYPVEKSVPADAGSGLHFSIKAPSRGGVDAFHAAALGSGGRDNGKPGLRADYGEGYYAAFVVDPDGYRIEAHFEG
jgi:catechol 2,3-dioxygenase-like lactoylglutathione lyase family enzyme